jgi:hypothetical protein
VEIGGRLVAAVNDLAQAVAHARVAGRAVDVEALLAALEHFHGHREGHQVLLFAVAVGALHDAGVEVAVFAQLAARHGVQHLGTRAAMVGEEIVPRWGIILGWFCMSWRHPATNKTQAIATQWYRPAHVSKSRHGAPRSRLVPSSPCSLFP